MSTDTNIVNHRLPAAATLAGGVLVVIGGVLAATVDMGFVALFAVGAFGPGLLRQLGLLRDQDEFQRQSTLESGYRAYLVGGTLAGLMVAAMRFGETSIEGAAVPVTIVLLLLVVTWLMSTLLSFWGAPRAVSWILLIFGSFWLVFTVLGNLTDPVALLMQALVPAPFFVLAWTSRRW